jgi:WD40 repeat protein
MLLGRCVVAVGVAAIGAALGGCQRHGVLDPGGLLPGGDGGVVGSNNPRSGDAGVSSSGGGGNAPDAGRADARRDGPAPTDGGTATGGGTATDPGAAADAGVITTAPPVSACALSTGRAPVAAANPTYIPNCGRWLPPTTAMTVGPAPVQSYRRCGTVGPETSWRVTLSPDSAHLAARTSAGTVRLYQTDSWREISQLASPIGAIDAVAFSPDGTRLAGLASETGRLTLWNVADGTPTAMYDGPPLSTLGDPSSALAFSSDGRRIATSLGTVIDLETGAATSFSGQPVGTGGRDAATYSLRFVGCDQRLLVDSASPSGMLGWVGGLSLIDLASGAGAGLAGGRFADVGSIVTSTDTRWVAFVQHGDTRKGLHLYDAAAAIEVAFDPTVPLFAAGFSRAGDRLYVVTDTSIDVREVPTLRMLRRTMLPPGVPVPTAAAVSTRDQVIVSNDRESFWVDAELGAMVRDEPFSTANAQFSFDGRYGLVDGTGPTLFRLWGEADPTVSCAPPASAADTAMAGFAVSQDARTLATVDAAGVVQLRPVDLSGQIGGPWATVETGVVGSAQPISIGVSTGGARVAVQGGVPGLAPGAQASRLVVADTADGTLRIVQDVPRAPGTLALSPDGAWVAYQDGDYTTGIRAIVLSVDDGGAVRSFTDGQIDSFSPDGRQLAVTSGGAMLAFDVASGGRSTTYSISGSTMSYAAMSPDWSLMGGVLEPIPYSWDDAVAAIWRPQDGSVVHQIGQQHDLWGTPRVDTSDAIVAAIVYGTHNVGTDWMAWHVWSVADGTELRAFPLGGYDQPFAILPAGRRLLTRAGTAIAAWCR